MPLNLDLVIDWRCKISEFEKTKPIRSQKPNPLPDRKALDDIIFSRRDAIADARGLTEAEQKEVCWSVADLVKKRLDKTRSV
ncbi:MAG: hypothetical protein QXJ28_03085 [Candidatus Pacearchaeota archaeon]